MPGSPPISSAPTLGMLLAFPQLILGANPPCCVIAIDSVSHIFFFLCMMTLYLFLPVGSTGAPPDYFATDGQNWGFPTYDWDAMAAEGYEWWINRLKTLARYFQAYRCVPVCSPCVGGREHFNLLICGLKWSGGGGDDEVFRGYSIVIMLFRFVV